MRSRKERRFRLETVRKRKHRVIEVRCRIHSRQYFSLWWGNTELFTFKGKHLKRCEAIIEKLEVEEWYLMNQFRADDLDTVIKDLRQVNNQMLWDNIEVKGNE
jgi:hypothetical protein